MNDNKLPVPPSHPKVDRVTGMVSGLRPEDSNQEQAGHIDGHVYSENPFEGIHAALNFNDSTPEAERAKVVAEFNKRSSNSVI